MELMALTGSKNKTMDVKLKDVQQYGRLLIRI
jgi:hypothetical protein